MTKFPFTIGADPEFSLLFNNNKIAANSMFQGVGKKLKLPCSNNMGYKTEAGVFGWDGHSVTGELRPKPSDQPKQVADHIGQLIKTISQNAPYLNLSVKNNYGSVGGHIHLSIPEDIAAKLQNPNNGDQFRRNQITGRIHRLLTYFCLPIFLGEDQINATIRRKGCYGKLDDYRLQDIGGHCLYEFRPLSAEWILSPKLTRAVLSYVAVVYNEILTNKDIDKEQPAVVNINQLGAISSLLDHNMEFLLRPCLTDITNRIRKFSAYADYKDEINYLLNYRRVRADKAKLNFSINRGWRLTQTRPTETSLERLTNPKLLTAFKKKIDIEPLLQLISLAYNDDVNVGTLVQELKATMVCHQWDHKYNYLFFGVRKGIDDFMIGWRKNRYDEVKLLPQAIVKNQHDFVLVQNTLRKISTKLTNTNDDGRQQILVGIPHNLRINNQVNDIITKLWQLEKLDKLDALVGNSLPTGKEATIKQEVSLEDTMVNAVHQNETENQLSQSESFTQEILADITPDTTTCAD